MKRWVMTTDCPCVDTKKLIPHLECYVEKDGNLYAEQISGQLINLGKILLESDSLSEVEGYDQSIFV
jgi:hypothetical protein